MEHTDIAPLAKRLAEENNVDWRRLHGSGEQGRIVERDVLEFLARVMAGDEDLDPTPEPLPEGMAAWPEDDVRAFEHEQRGEVPPSPIGVSTVDDEIFLLDGADDDQDDLADDDVEAGSMEAHEPHRFPDVVTPAAAESADDGVDEDDLLVAGDDAPAAGHAAMPDIERFPDMTGPDVEEVEDDVGVVAAGGERAGELPDLFDDRTPADARADGPVFEETGLGADPRRGSGPSLDEEEAPPAPPASPAIDEESVPIGARAGAAPPRDVPVVSHGAVWRRQVDLTSLVAAQADVARDLGLDDPVPALAFLARAAVKALDDGSDVAVAIFGEHAVRTVTIDAGTRPFAEVVRALDGLEGSSANGDGAALVVADLSDLELDEAVLHLGVPVLAMGRVLIDTSTGGRRATLSLSGDAVGRDAGRVLSRTAELLETPIRVVL